MGGEKGLGLLGGKYALGSPPRGRGKARHLAHFAMLFRITPAWAGKSLSRYLAAAAGRDHPRVGGEKGAFLYVEE